MEPDSKEPTKHGDSDNLGVTPPLGTLKAKCSDPLIAQQPLSLKITHFPPNM
jgi:hypothetical protein